jgi:hypothetical protein
VTKNGFEDVSIALKKDFEDVSKRILKIYQ